MSAQTTEHSALAAEYDRFKQEITDAYIAANKPTDQAGNPVKTCRFVEDPCFVAIQAMQSGKPQALVDYSLQVANDHYHRLTQEAAEMDRLYKEANIDPEEERRREQQRADDMMQYDPEPLPEKSNPLPGTEV